MWFQPIRLYGSDRTIKKRSKSKDSVSDGGLSCRIQRITLFRTGITELINDFDEVLAVPGVEEFIFDQGEIHYIQPYFHTVFPNLTKIMIRGTKFTVEKLTREMVTSKKPFKHVEITGNDFRSIEPEQRDKIIEEILLTLKMDVKSYLDFSHNGLIMSQTAAAELGRTNAIQSLNLQGNLFADYVSMANVFDKFRYLTSLDLDSTGMLKYVEC